MMNITKKYTDGSYKGLLEHSDTFRTEYDGVIRKFKINKGIPENYFSLSEEIEDNSCQFPDNIYWRAYNIAQKESVNVRIVAIENDDVVVEMELDNCEIDRKLNPFYVRKLKEMGLLYQDSIFQFIYTETPTGQNIEIKPQDNIVDEKISDFYRMLKTEIGIEC